MNSDGFIHCSKADQLLQVANTFFKGQTNLLILEIDTKNFSKEILKFEAPFEAPMSGVEYPHIYGSIPKTEIIQVIDFNCEKDGSFILPDKMI